MRETSDTESQERRRKTARRTFLIMAHHNEGRFRKRPILLDDAVTRMANVCGRTTFLELNAGLDVWAEAVLAAAAEGRVDNRLSLSAAGYDIESVARQLEELYLEGQMR